MTTLAHGTRLVATTRAVHPTRPLLDELGPDGFAWLRDDAGFVTSGAVARVNAAEAVELLASISHDDRVGVKWKWTLRCFLSQRSFFLCVLRLSTMT